MKFGWPRRTRTCSRAGGSSAAGAGGASTGGSGAGLSTRCQSPSSRRAQALSSGGDGSCERARAWIVSFVTWWKSRASRRRGEVKVPALTRRRRRRGLEGVRGLSTKHGSVGVHDDCAAASTPRRQPCVVSAPRRGRRDETSARCGEAAATRREAAATRRPRAARPQRDVTSARPRRGRRDATSARPRRRQADDASARSKERFPRRRLTDAKDSGHGRARAYVWHGLGSAHRFFSCA